MRGIKKTFSQRAVWRKRGGGSPESLCGFGSFAPVRAAVKAPPSPSRWDDVAQFAPLIALHRGGSRVANRFANSAHLNRLNKYDLNSHTKIVDNFFIFLLRN